MFENRKYYILDVLDKNHIDFSEIINKEFDNLRKSKDGTKCIIKIEGPPKEFLNNINSLEGPFSHLQIRNIVNGPYWTF